MSRYLVSFVMCFLTLAFLGTAAFASNPDGPVIKIVAVDPGIKTRLGSDEKLFVKVEYESDIPLRFQALAMRAGSLLEVGVIKNPAALHPTGHGEALAWVLYTNLTHADAVRVTAFDPKWKEIAQVVADVEVTWTGLAAETPRQEAEWVEPLVKTDWRQTDFVFDPSPRRYGWLFDIFFFLNVASLPAYLLLQLHMLYRYRYRWRELAMIPIFPYLIVGFYTLVGLEIKRSLLITFLFRYTFAAFLWLAALWLAKRYWQDKLPPPKLYKPPKTD